MSATKTTVLLDNVSQSGLYGPFRWDKLLPGHLVYSNRLKGIVSVQITGNNVNVVLAGCSKVGGELVDLLTWTETGVKKLETPMRELYISVQCETGDVVSATIEV